MRHRLAVIIPVYACLYSLSLLIAVLLRFEFRFSTAQFQLFFYSLPLYVGVKLAVSSLYGEWNRTYRHVSVADIFWAGLSCSTSAALLWGIISFAPEWPISASRSLIAIDCLVSVLLVSGVRLASYLFWKHLSLSNEKGECEPALIYGNDETSIGIWKMLSVTNGRLGKYRVVGFVDPSPVCQRSLIGGLPVYSEDSLGQQVEQRSIRHILVPTSTSGRTLRSLVYQCQQTDVKVHKIPTVEEMVEGRFRLSVRDLDIDDLLRRPPTQLDLQGISHLITSKTVLVTGGAGSIGSELCRQIAGFKPTRLIVFDHSEFGVFQLEREFAEQKFEQTEIVYITASILDSDALEGVFQNYRPELVFHAAAYKHVPLMQDNPCSAIRNNIMGTKAVVDAAHKYHSERFVLISTDKAVRPTSVMGATKLMAEKYLQAMAQTSSTKFITVRFGNVLNSVGSVVPTFRKQIEAGGPVTVTHEEMVRYFMTIPEAVQLVLQAGAVGHSGHVLILDMGEPVKIVDLAKDMIALSGLSYPEDIELEFTGLRPGEKMYEELFYQHEQGAEKVHEKIFLGSGYAPTMMEMNSDLSQLRSSIRNNAQSADSVLWSVVNRYVVIDDQSTSQKTSYPAAA